METMIREISLSDIRTSTVNIRRHDRDKDVRELAASIEAVGLLQPVVVRGDYGAPPYDLIVGQRRCLAHKLLGRRKIAAIFKDSQLSDLNAKIQSLTENALRVELNYADAAEATADLYDAFGRDIAAVCTATGMTAQTVRKYLDVKRRASPEILEMLSERKVTSQDVRRCLDAASDDIGRAREFLDTIAAEKLNKHEKDRVVAYGRAQPTTPVREIVEQAKQPHVEERVWVKLDPRLRQGLEKAVKAMALDAEAIAQRALEEWLAAQGFVQ